MIAALVALCCAGLAVLAFRLEGGHVGFVGTDFRTLVARETYEVDWVTGTVANLAVSSTVTDNTETTGRWDARADGGRGAYVDFKTRTVSSTSSSASGSCMEPARSTCTCRARLEASSRPLTSRGSTAIA